MKGSDYERNELKVFNKEIKVPPWGVVKISTQLEIYCDEIMSENCPSALDEFILAHENFEEIVQLLQSEQRTNYHHDDVKKTNHKDGRERCPLLLHLVLDITDKNEENRDLVTENEQITRTHFRNIISIFSDVNYHGMGYNSSLSRSPYPLDESLNIPIRKYAYVLREQNSHTYHLSTGEKKYRKRMAAQSLRFTT